MLHPQFRFLEFPLRQLDSGLFDGHLAFRFRYISFGGHPSGLSGRQMPAALLNEALFNGFRIREFLEPLKLDLRERL